MRTRAGFRLLARYKYPSVWETQEVFEHLTGLLGDTEGLTGDNEAPQETHPPMACPAEMACPAGGGPIQMQGSRASP